VAAAAAAPVVRTRGLAAAYAAATFFAFPQPIPFLRGSGGDAVLDLGPLLGFVAPALLVATAERAARAARRPAAAAARATFLASLAAHSLVLHWTFVVTVVYGGAPAALGLAAPVALASYVAAHSAAFGAIAGWLSRRGRCGPFAVACAWTAVDLLRSWSASGFPWATLGYAQQANPLLLPLASLGGVYALSFASALGGAAALAALRSLRSRQAPPPGVAFALGCVVALHLAGPLAAPAAPAGPGLRIGVAQGNIDQGQKWSPEWADRTLARYEELTREAVARGARLVIWPETAVPGTLDLEPSFAARVGALAREVGAVLVVGAVGIEASGDDVRFFDSAYLVDAEGRVRDRYDKSHLVPFGEYVPLRGLLGWLFGALARGIAPENVTAGAAPRAVEVPLGEPPGSFLAGTPICYELVFPKLVRGFAAGGAGLLLALTNDAWYGRTGAPHQFLAITAVRSAETGIVTARAANTGVSAIIDERGRVRERSRVFERALLVADVPLRAAGETPTFYVRHGDLFAWGAAAGLGAAIAAAIGGARRAGRREERHDDGDDFDAARPG
jgi:apolipoprotein N-acyltransferase